MVKLRTAAPPSKSLSFCSVRSWVISVNSSSPEFIWSFVSVQICSYSQSVSASPDATAVAASKLTNFSKSRRKRFLQIIPSMRHGSSNAALQLRRPATSANRCMTSFQGGMCMPSTMTYFIKARIIAAFHLVFGVPARFAPGWRLESTGFVTGSWGSMTLALAVDGVGVDGLLIELVPIS